MLHNFLLAVFAPQRDQQRVTALKSAGRCSLLLRLLASIYVLVQAVDSYYESYCQVFGQWRHGKKEKLE